MSRQHATPLLLAEGAGSAIALTPLGQQVGEGAVSEAYIQTLVHEHPSCLPIAEIDPMFVGAVSICTELVTSAGSIDNLLVTPSGLPVIVECKLWRNPEGRREVVGQILDYAKELSRWSSSDLQREVSRRLKRAGNPLLDLVRAAEPEVDEIQFNDALTANLRRGRFLLLIVGDGIREGVEAIAEYLQGHAGLHFSLGLVELPIFVLPDGRRLVSPRVLARTELMMRHVVAVPDGHRVEDVEAADTEVDADRNALGAAQVQFWSEFLAGLKLDDPEQPRPRPARQGYITVMLPAPGGSSWLNVFRDMRLNEVGVVLSSTRNSVGERAMQALVDDWEAIKDQIGGSAKVIEDKDGRQKIRDSYTPGPLDDPEVRKRAFAWLAERTNTFVNVLRPRVRSASADFQSRTE
jgi:hypothetical protein